MLNRSFVLIFFIAACGKTGQTGIERTQGALKEGQIEIGFPASYSHENVALWSSSSLRLAPGVAVESGDGALAALVNIGTGKVEIGGNARTGAIVSGGSISADGGASITEAQAAGMITAQAGANIGAQSPNTPLGELKSIRFTPEFPAGNAGVLLQNGASGALESDKGYGSVVVNGGCALSMSAGRYYLSSLQTEPGSTLRLDTTEGPVVVYVKSNLMFKGRIQVNGPAGSFLLVYLGRNQTSIESAFNGTLMAPNASLRLAPVGSSPGHRGSFFAKQIEAAEAHSRITFKPFEHWYMLSDVHPLVDCLRRYKAPNSAGLLGYENESDFPLTIPLGPANFVSYDPIPDSSRSTSDPEPVPPVVLEPGLNPRIFWVPFDVNGQAAWTLAGETAIATAESPLCVPGQAPAEDLVEEPVVTEHEPEQPANVGASALSRMLPEMEFENAVTLPVPVSGSAYVQKLPPAFVAPASSGDIGSISQPLKSEYYQVDPPPDGPFTFEITSFKYDLMDEFTLWWEVHAHNLVINGQSLGNKSSGTVWVSRDQTTVPVHIEIKFSADEDDDGIPLESFDGVIDNLVGGSGCTNSEHGGFCWRATGTASPSMCFRWPAQFLDAGPWPDDYPGGEDFGVRSWLNGLWEIQVLPASFAIADVRITHEGRDLETDPTYRYYGPLDANGCIPSNMAPFREQWKTGQGMVAELKLLTQFCYDPARSMADGKCEGDTGVDLVAHLKTNMNDKGTAPEQYCWRLAEDGTTKEGCAVRDIIWADAPTNAMIFIPSNVEDKSPYVDENGDGPADGQNGATRVAAVISQVLKRHDALLAKDGVGLNLLTGEQKVVKADYPYCANDPGEPVDPPTSSCEGSLGMYPRGSSFKYVVAHELSHQLVQDAGNSFIPYPRVGKNLLCSCDHVDTGATNSTHCLQSCDLPGEGFDQFFSAKVWNKSIADGENDCTFVYYKGFLNETCMPGVPAEHCTSSGVYKLNLAPIPINCAEPVQWRNNHCLDDLSSPDVLELNFGTEYDWMTFLWAINNEPDIEERWSMSDMASVSGGTWDDLMSSVEALKGDSQNPAAEAYGTLGHIYGVDDQWP